MFRNWLLLRNETRAFPGRRFWLFPVLPALLLLHQNSYGETGPESNEFSWRRILETDSGTPVYVLRRTGVSDLIVFVSRSTDGQTEIGSGAHELPGLG
ncbi:MAG: hypothetical protein KDK34_13855, partial [Leptospiraceae bacterium]|nr:hypothetical protein [Leptospiraceae bacterium]